MILDGGVVLISEGISISTMAKSIRASSLIASFANGITRDRTAVGAAIGEPWSNGQTEGRITKLKLVKRQMYGRGKLDLLEAGLIGTN
jgi:transposase